MSGVSDISFRALVMNESSAAMLAQELTHRAKHTAEITLESISSTFTHCTHSALLFLWVFRLSYLFAWSQDYTTWPFWLILILPTAAVTDLFLLCQSPVVQFLVRIYLICRSHQFSLEFSVCSDEILECLWTSRPLIAPPPLFQVYFLLQRQQP